MLLDIYESMLNTAKNGIVPKSVEMGFIINYGEVRANVKVGQKIKKGDLIGWVIPVLKVDKGKVPSTSMLHLELYTEYDGQWVLWDVGTPQPSNLLDPTHLLQNALIV